MGTKKQTRREQPLLLTATQVMERLGISRSTFYGEPRRGILAMRHKLRARGLRIVKRPATRRGGKPSIRYVAASLDKLIETAAAKEGMLC